MKDEGQGRKRSWNESEETEEIKHLPSTLICYMDSRPCPTVNQYHISWAPQKHKIHETFAIQTSYLQGTQWIAKDPMLFIIT